MTPSRSTRSSSRRSSILKPPKPRLPLQSLNFNNSSTDNSPATTTKIKRRVSFAEKKHVKEFCNSVEQGTVWDNTYEEHDVSSFKSSSTSSEGGGDVQSIFKENIQITEFHNEIVHINSENVDTYSTQVSNMQFVSNEIIHKDLNIEDCDMNFTNTVDNTECPHTLSTQEEILLSASSIVFHSTVKQKNESMLATNLQVNSNSHMHKNITVYEEPDGTTSNQVLDSQQSNINNVNCNDMNVTSVQNTRTTLGGTVCNTSHVSTNDIQNNKLEDTLKSTSMELTKAVPTSMNICRSISQSTNNGFQGQNTKKDNTNVEIAVDRVFDPIDNFNNGELVANESDNVSMEMTAAVSTLHRVDCDTNSVSYNNDKGITVFHDTSVEMTKPVQTSTDINMMCRNETSKVPQHKHDITCTSEKTMEITKAVSANIHSRTTHNFEKLGYNINPDKSSANIDNTLCIDEEMEFTTALTPLLQVASSNLNNNDSVCNTPYMHWNSHNSILNNYGNDHTNSLLDRTKIFHNKSVTATAIVLPASMTDVCENGKTKLNKQESSRTVLFPNMSMEITEAVSLLQNNLQTENSLVDCPKEEQLVSSKTYENKTLPNEMVDCETNLNKQESSRTALFPNMSMEITEAVSLLQNNLQTENSLVDCPREEQLVASKTYENKTLSNEMVDSETNLNKQESSRTVLFPNISMEITEAVPLLQNNLQTENSLVDCSKEEQIVSSKTYENKTLPNEMVDCETNLNKQESSRTALFPNMSMEITEAVSLLQNNHPTENSVVDCPGGEQLVSSKIYEDKTFPNKMVHRETNLNKQESSRTVLFPSMSMEITEAVSLLQSNLRTENSVVDCPGGEQLVSSKIYEKTFPNKMVDWETNLNKQESSKTALFPNMSMEITEAVSLLQNNHPTGNSVANSAEVEQLVSSEKYENKNLSNNSLNQTTIPDNVLKDITPLVIPSSLNSEACLEEENCVTANSKNLKECFSNEPALNEVINSVNSRISMTLHGSIEENTCASALEGNNAETACAPLHAASYDPSCVASSNMNQSKCLKIEHSQDIISHPRRTYVIKPCIDHSLINNSKENIKISEVNNVIQNKEISLTFFNESLEELESIKPPSFIGLDDLLDESVNVDTETHDLSKSLNRSKVIESAVQNNQVDVLVKSVDKSKICSNECTPLDDEPLSSNVEYKDQAQISDIQKLQLSFMNITNTELLIPDCSLPSTTITKRTLIFGEEKSEDSDSQDVCTDNFNVEDQNMECSSLNINDIHEETSKIDVENNYPCNGTSKLCNDQNIVTVTSTDLRETMESHESSIKNDISIELDPFASLIKELRVCARSNEIIWDVYHENIERKMFIIGFISCSLLVVIFLEDDCNTTNVQLIKDVKIISRLADDADVFISIVHRIIIQKLCIAKLVDIYRNNENILPMLEYISKEVKLAMDFMFDLKHLYNLNLMKITRDSISFVSLTKKMEIILKITVNVKPFEKIEFQDISVHCLLGSVREEDIKKLITNIKRDHRFFRRYMSDVRDYIYVMEDSCILNTIPR